MNKAEFGGKLIDSLRFDDRVGEMSDAEVASLLLEEFWAHEDMFSARSAVLSSAISRLRRANDGPLDANYEEADPS